MKSLVMALKKTACLSALVLFVHSPQAYGSGTAKIDLHAQTAAQNQTPSRPDHQQTGGTVVPAPSEFKEVFVGAIDSRHAIRMELERKGANLTGYYFYERGAFQDAMILHGQIDGDENVTLTETSYGADNPQKTGEFRGKLDGLSANDSVRLRFSGLWTDGKTGKQMPFGLQASEFERAVSDLNLGQLQFDLGALKLSKRRTKIADEKLCYKIVGEMPLLVGADASRTEPFNKGVADLVARYANTFKKDVRKHTQESKSTGAACKLDAKYAPSGDDDNLSLLRVDYDAAAANKNFISVIFDFHEYGGPGTGTSWSESFNYDLNRKFAINLADLFTPNSKYLDVISAYCIAELKEDSRIREVMKMQPGAWLEEGAGPKIDNFKSWNITAAGLVITFDNTHFAVAANTFTQEVVIPYAKLKPIIKPDGLLAQFAK